VLKLRRQRSPAQRLRRKTRELAKAAPQLQARTRELAKAAPQLDIPWARSWLARGVREMFLGFVLAPTMGFYTRRRATGRQNLARVRGPVILVANHGSHLDTPVILAALPRRMRKRTVVAAATDYFYRNRLVAMLVSLVFNTVPLDRCGGGLDKRAAGHVDGLLDRGWNLLLYPEGTRSRSGEAGQLRRGAAVLAARHRMPIVPIRLTGTRNAMPPGRFWPSRNHEQLVSKRHPVNISFGEPISPTEDVFDAIHSVQRFFEGVGVGAGDGRAN
jgi:1-acyl-sn-glycerol-3-phosphate acyltransferase